MGRVPFANHSEGHSRAAKGKKRFGRGRGGGAGELSAAPRAAAAAPKKDTPLFPLQTPCEQQSALKCVVCCCEP